MLLHTVTSLGAEQVAEVSLNFELVLPLAGIILSRHHFLRNAGTDHQLQHYFIWFVYCYPVLAF